MSQPAPRFRGAAGCDGAGSVFWVELDIAKMAAQALADQCQHSFRLALSAMALPCPLMALDTPGGKSC